jgi:hypothetical protein
MEALERDCGKYTRSKYAFSQIWIRGDFFCVLAQYGYEEYDSMNIGVKHSDSRTSNELFRTPTRIEVKDRPELTGGRRSGGKGCFLVKPSWLKAG